MKLYKIIVLFLTINGVSYAQIINFISNERDTKIDVRIKLKQSKDTVLMRALVELNENSIPTKVMGKSFYKKITIVEGKSKRKIKSSDVDYLEFPEDYYSKLKYGTNFFYKPATRIFVSDYVLGFENASGRLYEICIKGKVNFYKSYQPHPQYKNVENEFCRIQKGDDIIMFGAFMSKKKYRRLEEMLSDKPECKSKVMGLRSHDELTQLLKEYNSLSK